MSEARIASQYKLELWAFAKLRALSTAGSAPHLQ